MHERPILFSAAQVRAILDGRKTQTRRVLSPSSSYFNGRSWTKEARAQTWAWDRAWVDPGPSPAGNVGPYLHIPWASGDPEYWADTVHRVYPRHQVGQRLWVRESFAIKSWDEDGYFWFSYTSDGAFSPAIHMTEDYHERVCARLSSAGVGVDADGNYLIDDEHRHLLRRASIHMPRAASRITIEVTEVRVQRLQDISEEDARAEGFAPNPHVIASGLKSTARGVFAEFWNKMHVPSLTSTTCFGANPWVTAITFRRIDQVGGRHG